MNEQRFGSVVWWNANDVRVPALALRNALPEQYRELVPEPAEPFGALRRAASRRQGALGEGWRWEEIGRDANRLILGLIEGEGDVAARDWRSRVQATVDVDKATGVLQFMMGQSALNSEVIGAVNTAYAALVQRYKIERGELTQGDVRGVVLKILLEQCKGVRIKDGGSLYLLRAPHDAVVAEIAPAFAQAGMHLRHLEISGDGVAQLNGDIEAGLLVEVEAFVKDVERRRDAVEAGKGAREGTLTARRAERELLSLKLDMYRAQLGAALAPLMNALSRAEGVLLETETILTSKKAA